MKKTIITLSVLLIIITISNAQYAERNILSVSGGLFSSQSLSIEFAIGDIATETLSTGELILTQGFIQPDFAIPSNINYNISDLEFRVYPNPASQFINIAFNNIKPSNKYTIQISDLNGRLVKQIKTDKLIHKIDISELQPGTYIIRVKNNNLFILKSLKLQKIE